MAHNITSTSASLGSTPTTLPALTTPFVAPPSCSTVSQLTSFTTTRSENVTTISAIFSNPSHSNYGACQPTGWQENQSFSPAVCPSSWVAHKMATSIVSGTVVSTAHCCMSGYTPHRIFYSVFEGPFEGFGAMCESEYKPWLKTTLLVTFSSESDGSPTTAVTTFPTGGWLVHPAWHIAWQESDLPSLVPRPPDLTSNMMIHQWTPGQTIRPGQYDRNSDGHSIPSTNTPSYDSNNDDKIVTAIQIAIPLVVVFLIIGLSYFCCCRRKHRKARAAVAAEAELEEVQNQVLLANAELEIVRLRVVAAEALQQEVVAEIVSSAVEARRRRDSDGIVGEAPPPAYGLDSGGGGRKPEPPAYEMVGLAR